MTGQQARLVAVAASFVLALIFGGITGFIAPTEGSSDTDSPTDSGYSQSVSPEPDSSRPSDDVQESPKKSATPSKASPKVDDGATDSPGDDQPSDKPSASPSKSVDKTSGVTGAGVPVAAGTGGVGGGDVGGGHVGGDDAVGDDAGGGDQLAANDGGESFAVGPAAVAFLGALITGLVVVAVFSMVRAGVDRGRSTHSGPQLGSTRVMPVVGDASGPMSDRDALVDALIYVRDRATSAAISDRVGQALHDVGVVEVSPLGEPFDPALHEAGGSTTTPNQLELGLIAEVEVVGYVDRDGTVLRPPVVTVYRANPGPGL